MVNTMFNRFVMKIFILIGVAFIWLLFSRFLIGRLSPRPAGLGPTAEGRLIPCPSTPNCVSSQATDAQHRIEPIAFTIPAGEAKARLLQLIEATPNTKIIRDEGNYLYVEFRTPLWHFIDDVEFVVDAPAGIIHFRSASRLGLGDGDTNRRRLETLRAAWLAPAGTP